MSSCKSLIFVAVIAFLSFKANAEQTEAHLHCKITDQVLLTQIEGKPQRYTGFEDGYEKGDTLIFKALVRITKPQIY